MHPNCAGTDRLSNLLAIRKEMRIIRHEETECLVRRHNAFLNEESYSAARWSKAKTEGSKADFFIKTSTEGEKVNESENDNVEANAQVAGNLREDIKSFRAAGMGVDNDVEPTPKND